MMTTRWKSCELGSVVALQRGYDLPSRLRKAGDVPVVTSSGIGNTHDKAMVEGPGVVTGRYGTIGEVFFIREDFWPLNTTLFVKDFRGNDPSFAAHLLRTIDFHVHSGKSGVPGVNRNDLHGVVVCIPESVEEQRIIAAALNDVDSLLGALNHLIAKKRDLKQAAIEQLLTGQTRLPGFSGKWETRTLREATHCLDNLRVPINEEQRARMQGDYPYCGANGVLDYVDGYVVDDDIILMAEDGGYFDEYRHRPIAYRLKGKCWVNNHAHILKAKDGFSQGFVYYSLVHKNILRFLASGTRAKLNKSEMNKIEIDVSNTLDEQEAIATVLTDMDAELAALEQRRDKTRLLKQGMMQELLTGRTRLI